VFVDSCEQICWADFLHLWTATFHTCVDRSEVVVYDLFSHLFARSEVGVSLASFHTYVDRSEAAFLCIWSIRVNAVDIHVSISDAC
jgi:hypothetical protein